MNMKVYIVTNGEYSDYHIVKVFLDKAMADDFAERATTSGYGNDYKVEVYDTEEDANNNLLTFRVSYFKDVWDCNYVEDCDNMCKNNVFKYAHEINNPYPKDARTYKSGDILYLWDDKSRLLDEMKILKKPESFTIYLLAKDKDAALKIAHERLGAIKAMGDTLKPKRKYTFPSYQEYKEDCL